MKFLLFITFVISIIGCYDLQLLSKNYVVSTVKKKEQDTRCSMVCSNNLNNTLVVHMAVNNSLNMYVQARDRFTAMVYYKCMNITATLITEKNQKHKFQKLCGNRTDFCEESANSVNSSWVSTNEDTRQVLYVDIRLPHNVSDLRLKTQSCAKEPLIYLFTIEGQPIPYGSTSYEYEKDIFVARNLERSPIKLVITKYPNEHIAEIIFTISKSKCQFGMHKKSINDLGYKCFMDVDGKQIEGGYLVSFCGKNDSATKVVFGTDKCKSYSRPVCERDCYNMPNCSYICVVRKVGVFEEGGYLMDRDNESYPERIGSGPWTRDKLPVKLVLLDECSYDAELCGSGGICKDEIQGFSCTNGTMNSVACLHNQALSPYWQCPYNADTIDEALSTPELLKERNNSIILKRQIMNTFNGSVSTKAGLQDMFKVFSSLFSTDKKKSVNLTDNDMRQLAKFLLDRWVQSFFDYSDADTFTNESFYYQKLDIAEGKHNLDIPMSNETQKNKEEFIKLELKRSNSRSRRGLVAKYFRFKNMDIMNESAAIKGKMKDIRVLKDTTISPDGSDDEREVLYRNSEMFTLTVNGGNNVKSVKYKLQTFENMEPPSWLYEVDNACGFLDEKKDWQWSKRGCFFVSNGTESYCECDHLSNFAMLFSMKEVNKIHLRAFEILSIVGGIVNAVSLALFVVFVLFINSRDKLRIDQLNIAICLLLGTVIFLLGSLFSKNNTLCSVAALVNQFLFLSAFVWKLILGINVVRLIASLRYQNEDWMVKYRWIMLSAGYSLPLLIVIISGSIHWKDYGEVSENVCWIQPKSGAFLSFIIPVGIIIAVNTLGLFFIANTLIRNYINTHKTRMNESNEAIVFIQLLVSMGLTWLPAYFAIQYLSAMYLFVVFFPLQGLMMFLLVVVINKENREKVSSFFVNSYLSMTSKSTSMTDGKSNSKSKSTSNSKATEESENLLVGHGKEDKSDLKLAVSAAASPEDRCVTKC